MDVLGNFHILFADQFDKKICALWHVSQSVCSLTNLDYTQFQCVKQSQADCAHLTSSIPVNLYLVIGLASVSFFLLITILVTIVLKCQKPKPSKSAPHSRNSVISERNSTIADSTLLSNDAYWYRLFLAETRKGKH